MTELPASRLKGGEGVGGGVGGGKRNYPLDKRRNCGKREVDTRQMSGGADDGQF